MPTAQDRYREHGPTFEERQRELEEKIEDAVHQWHDALAKLQSGGWKTVQLQGYDVFPPLPGTGKSGPVINALKMPKMDDLILWMQEWQRIEEDRDRRRMR